MVSRWSRFAVMAMIIVIAGTTIDVRPLLAASADKAPTQIQNSQATEFSARKKRRYRRDHRQALRMFGAMAGMFIGLAEARRRERYYRRYYGYPYDYPYGPPPYGYYYYSPY